VLRPFDPKHVPFLASLLDGVYEWFATFGPEDVFFDIRANVGDGAELAAHPMRSEKRSIMTAAVRARGGRACAHVHARRRLDDELKETVEHRRLGTFPRVFDALFVRR
jgi:hypothetical protein